VTRSFFVTCYSIGYSYDGLRPKHTVLDEGDIALLKTYVGVSHRESSKVGYAKQLCLGARCLREGP
jgi:hypothetical protein